MLVLPNQSRVFSAVIKAPVSGRATDPRGRAHSVSLPGQHFFNISTTLLSSPLLHSTDSKTKMRLQAVSPRHSNISHIIATFFTAALSQTEHHKKGSFKLIPGRRSGADGNKERKFTFSQKKKLIRSVLAAGLDVWSGLHQLSPVLEMSSVG